MLVFTRTKHGANKLTEKLSAQGLRAAALHGNKSQSFRTRTLEAFKKGEIRVLVATDVAARGIDIRHLPHVVNYDMPESPEGYVHRIGRTGRAGVSGVAISLVSHDEKRYLRAIEKQLKQKILVETIDGYTEDGKVPDFILYRPDSPSSGKKADTAIKALVERRTQKKAGKKQSRSRQRRSGKQVKPRRGR